MVERVGDRILELGLGEEDAGGLVWIQGTGWMDGGDICAFY